MARQYPRFLFSDPKNTKSEGPFLVHLMRPRFVAKVLGSNNHFVIKVLEQFDPPANDDHLKDAIKWISAQIERGEISL